MKRSSKMQDLRIVSEVELIYRSEVKASQRPHISSSRVCYEVLLKAWNQDRIELLEEFKILLLNNASRVLGLYEVSKGGKTGTVVDVRLIFAAALKANATKIILAHNHPAGGLEPSTADLEITRKIKHAGCILDIKILDHLIITRNGYYSFADEGNL